MFSYEETLKIIYDDPRAHRRDDYYRCLFEEAGKIPENGLYVELGTLYGSSALAVLCGSHPSVKCVLIDPIFASDEPFNYPDAHHPEGITLQSSRQQLESRLTELGFTDRVEIVPLRSWDALVLWDGRKADLILIDAQHDYAGVLSDCEWLGVLDPNGTMLVDDWFAEARDAAYCYLSQHPGTVKIEYESTSPPRGNLCITKLKRC